MFNSDTNNTNAAVNVTTVENIAAAPLQTNMATAVDIVALDAPLIVITQVEAITVDNAALMDTLTTAVSANAIAGDSPVAIDNIENDNLDNSCASEQGSDKDDQTLDTTKHQAESLIKAALGDDGADEVYSGDDSNPTIIAPAPLEVSESELDETVDLAGEDVNN